MPKKTDKLLPGEAKYVATVKLRINWGRDEAEGGDVLILGQNEEANGVNVQSLLRLGALVPYESEEHAQGIRDNYNDVKKPARDKMRQDILSERRAKRGQNSR